MIRIGCPQQLARIGYAPEEASEIDLYDEPVGGFGKKLKRAVKKAKKQVVKIGRKVANPLESVQKTIVKGATKAGKSLQKRVKQNAAAFGAAGQALAPFTGAVPGLGPISTFLGNFGPTQQAAARDMRTLAAENDPPAAPASTTNWPMIGAALGGAGLVAFLLFRKR